MGVLISSAVVPLTLTLLWSKQSKLAAIVSPIFGFCAAVSTWLAVTQSMYGEISVLSTSQNYPMMSGNIVALISPIFVTVTISLIKPDNFNFDTTRAIQRVDDSKQEEPVSGDFNEGEQASSSNNSSTTAEGVQNITTDEEELAMAKSSRFAKVCSIILSLILVVLWPLPMFFSKYVFSKPFFTGWVVVSIIWIFFSIIAVGLYPLYEARRTFASIFREIWRDITGKRVPNLPTTNKSAMILEENIVVYNAEKKYAN
jgi:Na+/proline symporter